TPFNSARNENGVLTALPPIDLPVMKQLPPRHSTPYASFSRGSWSSSNAAPPQYDHRRGDRIAVRLCGALGRYWQILLQKSFMVPKNSDSVAVMRFAVEASDDGAAQSGPRAVVLFISS